MHLSFRNQLNLYMIAFQGSLRFDGQIALVELVETEMKYDKFTVGFVLRLANSDWTEWKRSHPMCTTSEQKINRNTNLFP